jgi:hypothetical protein
MRKKRHGGEKGNTVFRVAHGMKNTSCGHEKISVKK